VARSTGSANPTASPIVTPRCGRSLRQVFDELTVEGADLWAVGHRVVHGGARFTAPVLIDDEVLAGIRDLIPLPVAQPRQHRQRPSRPERCYPGWRSSPSSTPTFDRTLPEAAATYAIHQALAHRLGIRRYGFHGTSHRYVAQQTAVLFGRPLDCPNLIVLHLAMAPAPPPSPPGAASRPPWG
jgi:acetate kinase